MGEGGEQSKDQWMMTVEGDDGEDTDDTSSLDDSGITDGSFSSLSDAVEDDASSSSCSSSNSDHGPLYQLSELMSNLPIKRGLSKFYQGKSQSFTSLSRVASIEDLPKKESPYKRKIMKACKSYGNGLDAHKPYTLPKAVISKKASRSPLSPSFPCRRGSFLNSSRPPPVPVQQKF